ncbi:hypothetical protein GQ600_16950 [Phytophthora cactorum]|nr:hypothetical protein GQ600_16950 [Phytophthora cactorum]
MMTGEGSIDARFAVLLSSEEGSDEEKKTDDSAEGQGGPLEALELAQRGSAKSQLSTSNGLGSAPTYVVSKRKRSSKRVDTLIKDITDMEERQERASQEITKLEDVNRRAEADSKRRLEAREESARIEWEERD